MSITIFNTESTSSKFVKLAAMTLVGGGLYLGYDAYMKTVEVSRKEQDVKVLQATKAVLEQLANNGTPGYHWAGRFLENYVQEGMLDKKSAQKLRSQLKIMQQEGRIKHFLENNNFVYVTVALRELKESGKMKESEIQVYRTQMSAAAREVIEGIKFMDHARGVMKSYSSKGYLLKHDKEQLKLYFASKEKNKHHSQLEKAIAEWAPADSQKLLDKFKKQGLISGGSYVVYQAKIGRERNKRRVALLVEYVKNENYPEASKLLAQLKQEKSITPKKTAELTTRIHAFSLEGLLERVESSVGRNKIAAIDRIGKKYPKYEGLPQLRKKQLKAYVGISTSQFLSMSSAQEVLDNLQRFYPWLRMQNDTVLAGQDFTQFFASGEAYIAHNRNRPKQVKKNYVIGDQVVIRRNLGPLMGKTKNDFFYADQTTKKCPLGSKGLITKLNYNGQSGMYKVTIPTVAFPTACILVKGEFEPSYSSHSTPAISQYLSTIKQYIQKGAK